MYAKFDVWSACSIVMNDHACILIWDAHMHMRHNIVPYAYRISHTCMGRPILVWANIAMHVGQNIVTRLAGETGHGHRYSYIL